MISQLSNLNWIGVAAAFIAYFMLGALWFTLFFKKQYAKSLGKENEPPQKPTLIFILGPAVCTLVITLASAVLIDALNISSMSGAVEFALIVGIGFLVANTTNIAINPNMPRPIHYATISGGYHLTGILIVSLILVAMK
jgi:hypothetical protein